MGNLVSITSGKHRNSCAQGGSSIRSLLFCHVFKPDSHKKPISNTLYVIKLIITTELKNPKKFKNACLLKTIL